MQIEILRPMTSARLAVINDDATLRMAARAFSNPQIGLLIVCDRNRAAAGVVSKSDIIRHLAVAGTSEALVAPLMTHNIVSCLPEDELYTTWQRMIHHRLQNMPILGNDSRPVGVLDIRDALQFLFKEEEYQERLLRNYVGGVGYQ